MRLVVALLVVMVVTPVSARAESWLCPEQLPSMPPQTVKYSIVGNILVKSDNLDRYRKNNGESPISWPIVSMNAHGIVAMSSLAEILDPQKRGLIGVLTPTMWVSVVAIDRDSGAFHFSEFHVASDSDRVEVGICQREE